MHKHMYKYIPYTLVWIEPAECGAADKEKGGAWSRVSDGGIGWFGVSNGGIGRPMTRSRLLIPESQLEE